MPVVLSQHPFSDRYRDVEGVVYNFPAQYYAQIQPFDRFLYYRPSKGAERREASCYIAHGVLGIIYPTPDAQNLRTVEIGSVQYFKHPVPFRDPEGRLYESGFESASSFQGRAVRQVRDIDFFRIVATANVTESELSTLVPTETAAQLTFEPRRKSELRKVTAVPPGTGYVPTGNSRPDPVETAALQERARGDHQLTLKAIIERTIELGGECSMKNNIDLLSQFGQAKILFEAKSLLDVRMAVDRMRYAIGQLADYQRRYADLVGNGQTAVAFGNSLGREEEFVGDVLDSKGIGLVLFEAGSVHARNRAAHVLPLFS